MSASREHRCLCVAAAGWLLERGCQVAAYEADVMAWAERDHARAVTRLAGLTRSLAELVDAFDGQERRDLIGARGRLSSVLRRVEGGEQMHHVLDALGIRWCRPRRRYDVLVVEVKVSVEDLRRDGKMGDYGALADYGYLLVPAGLAFPSDLAPDGWGLLGERDGRVCSTRPARRLDGTDAGLRTQVVRGLRGHRHRNVVWRE